MSGICLTIDIEKQLLLNELINQNLNTVFQLDLLVESCSETNLINHSSYEWIKKSIEQNDQHGLVNMLGSDNREKLIELALIKSKMWLNKKELSVHILPHPFNNQLNQLIDQYSKEWTPYCGITFNFVTKLPADIIIELNGLSAHSSYIGTDSVNYAKQGLPTMKLGIGVAMDVQSIRRPIIHEFGHALGCIHEHQSPASSIQWDEPAVIRQLAFGGWNENMVRHNVFRRYTSGTITNSVFDPDSIMIYPIPSTFTINGFHIDWNTQLSNNDKEYMKKAYSVK